MSKIVKGFMPVFPAFGALLAALALSCANPASPPPQAPGGTAQVRFAPGFGSSAQASPALRSSPALQAGPGRTVFPSAPAPAGLFPAYTFTKGGESKTPAADGDGVYTLETGDWAVTAKAYLDADHEQLVGESIATPFTVSAEAGVQNIPILLRPIADSGQGAIDYAISYPATATLVALTLAKAGGGTAPDLSPYTDDGAGQRTHGAPNLPAPAGYYDLTVRLVDSLGRTAGKNDVVHVYQNMKTTIPAADWTFTDADFTALLVETAAVTNLVAPVTGKAPAILSSLSVAGGAHYTVTGLTWKLRSGSSPTYTWTDFSGNFVLATYRAAITLKADSGYKFSATPTVNTTSGGTVGDVTLSGDTAENTLTFTVSFPATSGDIAKVEPEWDIPKPQTLAINKSRDTDWISAAGTLTLTLTGSGYSDIQWTVNGSPVAADDPAYIFKGAGRSLGTYTVGVQAKTTDGRWYENWVTITVFVIEAKLVLEGDYLGGITAVVEDGLLKSITPTGKDPILIGRKADEPVTLNLGADGKLQFRTAVSGSIPIGSYGEFQLIRTASGGLSGKYKQEADLDLMGIPPASKGSAWSGQQWTAIGASSSAAQFKGTFDGGGKAISNLFISNTSADDQGLFGYVGQNGTVQNVHIASGSVTGRNRVGGVAGENRGAIIDCSNSGDVTGTNSNNGVGGVVGTGLEFSTITACSNTGNVTGTGTYYSISVGGVVGYLDQGVTVTACYNTGDVICTTPSPNVGGVVGRNWNTNVTACYNIGAVVASGSNVGAVVGNKNSGSTTACYWIERTDVTGSTSSDGGGTKFGEGDAWPSNDASAQWAIGNHDGTSGNYWKSLGGWNSGRPVYPKLWWEK
ncbi:GLUG domain protein [Treponema primitia ZAS-2]|uniref:GLUG domain protein n=1 Tax=Treponema primitia (strain ATCC BAA-887 / DSM 12427 / ZAS-2) TaxID=545694 RepID=F5YJ80_TREPZ|nr:GLUG motif-containing protein [Treponema primitia]AEF84298.1 GLUG domain protein [Treponema primitia ZAS-2]